MQLRWDLDLDREFERRSNEDSLVNAMGALNPLTSCIGFNTKQIQPCTMHCVNLGLLQVHSGALLQILCHQGSLFNILSTDNSDILTLRGVIF